MKGNKMKKSTKKLILLSILIFVLLGVSFSVLYFIKKMKLEKEYKQLMYETEEMLNSKRREVFLATKKIKIGEKITMNNTKRVEYYSDSPQEDFISQEDFGKRVLIQISKDKTILKCMVTKNEIDPTLREQEFTEINLSANLKKNDMVDVRIAYPNGESFVVLSQKTLKLLSYESNGCYIDLDSEELDRVQSAFVDCYLHKGTLYTVKYVQESFREASIVNYTPSVQVINLIERDPNILRISSKYLSETARANLEVRLNTFRKVLNERQLEEKQQERKLIELDEKDEIEDVQDVQNNQPSVPQQEQDEENNTMEGASFHE